MTDTTRFIQLCRDEGECLSRLLVLLEEEQGLLVRGETLALEPLTDEKVRVLSQLAEQGRLRLDLMQAHGLLDREALLQWLSGQEEACAVWVALEKDLARAHALNESNGRFITEKLARTEEALHVLRTAAASTLGYGRDGATPTVPVGGRHLGSA